MNSLRCRGLASLGKDQPFFAPWLVAMQLAPDDRANRTQEVSDHRSKHDEGNRSQCIEWFNRVNRLDHVRPESEIDDRLPSRFQQEVTKRNAIHRSIAPMTSPTLLGLATAVVP